VALLEAGRVQKAAEMKLALTGLGIIVSIAILLAIVACTNCPFSFTLFIAAIYVMFVLGAALCAFAALWPWFESGRVAPGKRQRVVFVFVWLVFLVGLWTLFHPTIDL
jgi:hypothetical protein